MNAESIGGNGALFFGILISYLSLVTEFILQNEREKQKTGRRKILLIK